MNKTALQEIQRTLNIIRNQIDAVDAETKWAALELMLASSTSVVALAKKMIKQDTKTVTRTISIPKTKTKTKIVKQPALQHNVGDANHTKRTVIKPLTPQKLLSNQRANR